MSLRFGDGVYSAQMSLRRKQAINYQNEYDFQQQRDFTTTTAKTTLNEQIK